MKVRRGNFKTDMNIGYSSPDDWFDSKFTVADLNRKSVAYRLLEDNGEIQSGEGTLIAASRGNLMRVHIALAPVIPRGNSPITMDMFIIPGSNAANLVRNPPGSKCEFSYHADF